MTTPAAVTFAAPLDASFVFLGTASMRPSKTRNVSGNALRIGGEWTIVDCGEGTQHQILQCNVAPGRVNRIFVTHLHGDHCFGLPGLMCLLSNNAHVPPPDVSVGGASSSSEGGAQRVVQIVGPRGLRNMIRASLLSSATVTTYRFRVDELWPQDGIGKSATLTAAAPENGGSDGGAPFGGERYRHYSDAFSPPLHPCEIEGLDVRPSSRVDVRCDDGDGRVASSWEVPPHPVPSPMGDSWTVLAAPLQHSVPCVGYTFRERPHAGKLDVGSVREIIVSDENRAYQSSVGVGNPLSLLGRLQRGENVDIMEGGRIRTLRPDEFLGPPRPGRTVVVLGDTCDSRQMAGLAFRADLVVHESTNAAVGPGEDEDEVLATAVSRGHSTPEMAGSFAKACGARRLALTHFSTRYKGDDSDEGRANMEAIAARARETFGRDDVLAARDLMEVAVPFGGRKGKTEGEGGGDSYGPVDEADALRRAASAADLYLRRAAITTG